MPTNGHAAPSPFARSAPALQDHSPGSCAHSHRVALACDDAFVEMLGAYRGGGGLAQADEVVALLERGGLAGIATLARWIVERRVIHFEWLQQTWLPWFQFKRADHQPAPVLQAVFAELGSVYDGWEMALWFARPNSALSGGAPLQLIDVDADSVLHAARADRYIAKA